MSQEPIHPSKGLFIVFEGIDGSGTTTQSELLQQRFLQQQEACILTAEPSTGPIGTLIRQILKGRLQMGSKNFEAQMAHLFAADRHDHLYNPVDGIFTLLEQGKHVICTRYIFSSIAYHSDAPEVADLVHRLNQDFPMPDVVIYLNQQPEISMQRIQNRSHKDIYENIAKLEKVVKNYANLWQSYSKPLLIQPANEPVEKISEAIWQFLLSNRAGNL